MRIIMMDGFGYGFWLGTRCVEWGSIPTFDMAKFDINNNWYAISRDYLFTSNSDNRYVSFGLRPIVSIDLEEASLKLEEVYNNEEKRVEYKIVEKNP